MKYEEQVRQFLTDDSLLHLLSGLSAECGEVNGIFQKAAYKHTEIPSEDLLSEMGDVLFYLTALATAFGLDLDQIKSYNIEKLTKRHGSRS